MEIGVEAPTVAVNCTVFMQDGESIVIDPNFKEEAAASGIVTVIVNTNSDVCTIKKTSGVGISTAQVCLGSPFLHDGPHAGDSTVKKILHRQISR